MGSFVWGALGLAAALAVVACEDAPPPPTPKVPAPIEAPAVHHAPPPRPVEATEAFYIASVPKTTAPAAPRVTVCHSNTECNALLPPDPPNIVRRFSEEAWVVINLPPGFEAKNVVSDGTTATVRVEPASSASGAESAAAKVVLYRVAPAVTTVKLSMP